MVLHVLAPARMSGDAPTGPTAAYIEDDVVATVVEHYDDPDHPDALSAADARDLLESLQDLLEDRWPTYVDAIRAREVEAVRDVGPAVVLHDPDRREWNRLLDDLELYDHVDRTVVRMCHHRSAGRLADRAFESVDPVVVGKPDDPLAGRAFVEAVFDSLLRAGVRPGDAWAYYGVDVRGYGYEEWAERAGYDGRMSVADAAETARDVLGE